MRRTLVCLLVILSVVTLSGCTQAPQWLQFGKPQPKVEAPAKLEPQPAKVEGTLLASINGRVITLEDFNARIQAYNNEIQAAADLEDSLKANYLIKSAEDKKRLLEGMVERELLISEAIARGIDKDAQLQKAIKALEEQLLFAKIIEVEKAKVNVTSQDVENFYNMYKDAFTIPEERKVSMIVLASEDKAKEIMIQLLQGSDFATLARDNSLDQPSAANGGDIGFIVRRTPIPQTGKKAMFEKLEEVAFTLELNKPSTIFPGPDGFYIIKVTETKPASQQLVSEVYKDIEEGLMIKKQDEALETLVGNLRKGSNVVVHEELLRN